MLTNEQITENLFCQYQPDGTLYLKRTNKPTAQTIPRDATWQHETLQIEHNAFGFLPQNSLCGQGSSILPLSHPINEPFLFPRSQFNNTGFMPSQADMDAALDPNRMPTVADQAIEAPYFFYDANFYRANRMEIEPLNWQQEPNPSLYVNRLINFAEALATYLLGTPVQNMATTLQNEASPQNLSPDRLLAVCGKIFMQLAQVEMKEWNYKAQNSAVQLIQKNFNSLKGLLYQSTDLMMIYQEAARMTNILDKDRTSAFFWLWLLPPPNNATADVMNMYQLVHSRMMQIVMAPRPRNRLADQVPDAVRGIVNDTLAIGKEQGVAAAASHVGGIAKDTLASAAQQAKNYFSPHSAYQDTE